MIPIDRNPSPAKLRWFGLLWFPAFGGFLGLLVLRHTENLRTAAIAWSVFAAIAVVGWLSHTFLRWVWIGLLTLTFPIGWVISHLILFLVYYLVVTPIGLVLRLTGHDPMKRRLDRQAATYWQERTVARDPKSYFRQS